MTPSIKIPREVVEQVGHLKGAFNERKRSFDARSVEYFYNEGIEDGLKMALALLAPYLEGDGL